MKIATEWDSGPTSYTRETTDDDPSGVEVDASLWAEYLAARKRYMELETKILDLTRDS